MKEEVKGIPVLLDGGPYMETLIINLSKPINLVDLVRKFMDKMEDVDKHRFIIKCVNPYKTFNLAEDSY